MVVLLWAFRRRKRNPHNPANYRRNSVAYTSTHDTDTAAGWFAALTPRQRDATGLDPREPQWGLIELAYASPAALAIVPAQDVLGLGSEARMNRPGRTGGNWRWQLERGALTSALARRLHGFAERHRRLVE
jgi:4-alpha-glucanotransferase